MADFEENVEEMMGTTTEAAAMATESGGVETETKPRTRPGMRPAVPAVPETRPVTRQRQRLVTRRQRPVG